MAEHDALGPALRARGEQDDGRVVALDAEAGVDAPGEQAVPEAAQALGGADLLAQLLEPEELGPAADGGDRRLELGLGDELARRHHQLDLGGDDGRLEVGGAGREVEHRRHAAIGLQRHEHDHGGIDVGHQHAHALARLGQCREPAAEDQGARHQLEIVEMDAAGVLQHREAPAVPAAGTQQRLEQGPAPVGGAEDHVGHDLVELQVGDLPAGLAAQGRVDRELARRADGDGDLGEPVPGDLAGLEPGEPGQLRPLQPDRDDGGPGAVGDVGRAGIDLHQRPGDAEPALREDHAGLAGVDLADQVLDRQRVGGIQRVDVGDPPERLQPPAIGHAGIDGERRQRVQRRQQQRTVEERDVVDDHQHLLALP